MGSATSQLIALLCHRLDHVAIKFPYIIEKVQGFLSEEVRELLSFHLHFLHHEFPLQQELLLHQYYRRGH